MTRILVVDDDVQIVRALDINLRAHGYEVVMAATGEAALTSAAAATPDLVIVDLGLPGLDGIDVIRGLRGWTTVPIIVVSAREGDTSKVAALDAGADDYVTKPFSITELLARVRASLRRHQPVADDPIVETSDFVVDFVARRVTRNGTAGASDADRMVDRRIPRPPSGPVGHAATTSAAGVGSAVRERDELPAGPHGGDPPEARTDPGTTPVLPHRSGCRVPIRGVLTRS